MQSQSCRPPNVTLCWKSLLKPFHLFLSALEIGCIESFGEPVINWSEKFLVFRSPALMRPESAWVRGPIGILNG
jgi:hypothetical protein